ncbi:MAG TPA: hypothetical protein PK280_00480 [Planctomycetota bacterium]|nr:hypothetical protein [Planctomycetota bacterium]
MIRALPSLLLCGALGLAAPLRAGEPDPSPSPAPQPEAADPEEARARILVAQLGDNEWEKREAASKALAAMGASALPVVEAALKSPDAEIATRAAALADAVRANARREISERCLIKDLFFCGPFPFKREETKPLDLPLPPDEAVKPEAVYKTAEGEARWLRPFKPGARGAVDFDAVFGHREYAVAYALSSVQVGGAGPRKLLLLLGSDDSAQVRVNGKMVHTNPAARGVVPDQDAVEVTLEPGWNDIVVKVAQFAGAWGVCLRLTEPDRSEAKGLVWDPTRGGERKAPPPPPAPEPEKKP